MLLRSVLNQDPCRKGDNQWIKVVNEIQDKFEENVTVRTVRGRIKTLIKNLNSNDLQYKSGVAEEEDSEIINLLRIIIAIEEEEKAAMNNARALKKSSASIPGIHQFPASAADKAGHVEGAGNVPAEVARNVPEEVAGNLPEEVAGNVPAEVAGEIDDEPDDLTPRLSAAKKRKLEKEEADLERRRYLDEASGPSTSR